MKKFCLVLVVALLAVCLVAPAVAHGLTTYNARVYAKPFQRVQVGYRPGNLTVVQWTPLKTLGTSGYADFTGLSGTPVYARCYNSLGALKTIPVTSKTTIGGKLFYVFDFRPFGIW